jgi:uncharacterized cupin superfamily protein
MLLDVNPMAMWRGAQMPIVSVVKPEVEKIALEPSPINRDWILEGDPRARAVLLSSSADGTASTFIWDCTAGRFNWYYGVDETIYVLEGGMTIKDAGGTHHLNAGHHLLSRRSERGMDRQIVRSKDRLCADKTAAIIGIRQASLSALEASSAHRRQSACRSTR